MSPFRSAVIFSLGSDWAGDNALYCRTKRKYLKPPGMPEEEASAGLRSDDGDLRRD